MAAAPSVLRSRRRLGRRPAGGASARGVLLVAGATAMIQFLLLQNRQQGKTRLRKVLPAGIAPMRTRRRSQGGRCTAS